MKKTAKILILSCKLAFGILKVTAQDTTSVTVNAALPELPAYDQPPCPVDGYLWVPGY